jgi:hypothetical protein
MVISWDAEECPDGPPAITLVSCEAQRANRADRLSPPERVAVANAADVEALLRRSPEIVMVWPMPTSEGVFLMSPGLLCRSRIDTPAKIQVDPQPDSAPTYRAILARLAAHNRMLLADGKLKPEWGCHSAPEASG